MRKLSLLTYSIYELEKIDFDHSLKIMNMLYDAEKDNVRLQAPLAIWIYLNDKGNLEMGPQIKKIVKDMYEKYPIINEGNALKYLKNSNNEELNKFYNSFLSENMRRDENYFKDKMRDLIKSIQKEKNLSNYRICKLAGVDMGNFHSYYVLNKNNKLSTKKIMKIVDVCDEFH